MSQTETLLLIVLGFAVASLLALFIGRFAWNTALRLGARRMQRQVPSTVAELQSERDRLRAEYAMLSQRLGTRLEVIKSKMAEQMAEVTRHRNRLEVLRADLANRESEIVSWRDRVSGLEQEIEQRRQDIEQRKAAEASLKSDIAELRAELGHRDQKISALDSELLQATSRESEAQERLRQRIGELTSMSQQIAANRQQIAVRQEEFPAEPLPLAPMPVEAPLDENFAAAERETLDLQRELARLDQTWGEKLAEMEKKREVTPDNIIALNNRIRQQQ